jgi:fumarate hydratase class II
MAKKRNTTESPRSETDSMGQVEIPAGALYGPTTARAVANFPISGWRMLREFVAALGMIKQAAAAVHAEAGRLDGKIAKAIIQAAQEVIDGDLDEQFPVDVFQTGSGTSSNMNANEVIANRAIQILGGAPGDKGLVHPNDHVNMAQSSNDVIPTALHISTAMAIHDRLVPALRRLHEALEAKAGEFDEVVKVGRTHLMDAVPIRLGQEFSGYAKQIDNAQAGLLTAMAGLSAVTIGGTAVGTGLNAPEDFGEKVCALLREKARVPISEVSNHFAAQGARDVAVYTSGVLRVVALAMGKIASDIRLMGSGPRCGFGELLLPAVQPGSSMMPGKVNPVICESVVQVVSQVVGCDAAIAAGATGGVGGMLELNVAVPMISWNLLTAINLLAGAADVFREKCIAGLKPDKERCEELLEQSLATVTALAPRIGYDAAAGIAKEAYAAGKTIREICLERKIVPEKELSELLDPRRQTGA